MIDDLTIDSIRPRTSNEAQWQLSTLYGSAADAGLGFMLSWQGPSTRFLSRFFADPDEGAAFAAARAAEGCDVWTSVALYREAPPEGHRVVTVRGCTSAKEVKQ
jgi:hypothetical protein